jgi:hypothetical protein
MRDTSIGSVSLSSSLFTSIIAQSIRNHELLCSAVC